MVCALFFVPALVIAAPASTGSLRISGDSFPDFAFQIPIGNIAIINSDEIVNGTAIGMYIGIIYQWAVGFAAVLSVLAFTYAGVLWLIAGGDSGKVTESKKIMGNALIGLLLALGSYLFLTTINPNLVHFQPLRVPAVKTIQLNLTPAAISAGGVTTAYAVENFTKLGFPPPNNEDFDTNPKPPLTGAAAAKWKELAPIAADAAGKTGVDIGFIGMWMWLETTFDPLAENCGDTDYNPNTPCTAPLWQVGFNQFSDVIGRIDDDMKAMYGTSTDAQMREIGKRVLQKLKAYKNPITVITDADFDSATLSSIVSGARSGDAKSKALLATIMKDEKIGIYEIAIHFKKDKGYDAGLANEMDGWVPRTKVTDPRKRYYTPQKISNLIKAVYDAK
jgi:hypothetical protein